MTERFTDTCQVAFTPSDPDSDFTLRVSRYMPAVVEYTRDVRYPPGIHLGRPQGVAVYQIVSIGDGNALLELYQDDPQPVDARVIRGHGSVLDRGWRTREVDHLVRFRGHTAVPVATSSILERSYCSTFRDAAGRPVDPPAFFRAGRRQGVYRHDQPVFGAMIIRYKVRYRLLLVTYTLPDFVLTMDQSGSLEQASGSILEPLTVAAMTRRDFALIQVTRRVDLRKVDSDIHAGPRIEIWREGVVDRVFPTPPTPSAPPIPPTPDPRTGRMDYMDVERATSLIFRTDFTNRQGEVVQSLYTRENLSNHPPENSYQLGFFVREGWEES